MKKDRKRKIKHTETRYNARERLMRDREKKKESVYLSIYVLFWSRQCEINFWVCCCLCSLEWRKEFYVLLTRTMANKYLSNILINLTCIVLLIQS